MNEQSDRHREHRDLIKAVRSWPGVVRQIARPAPMADAARHSARLIAGIAFLWFALVLSSTSLASSRDPTEFARPQSARLKLRHQSRNLLAAPSLTPLNFLAFAHPHNSPNFTATDQVWLVGRILQFGLGSALPRTMFLHFNRRPNEGSKWSTVYLEKSTIYLQFALQLNRRLRGRGAHFWSTI